MNPRLVVFAVCLAVASHASALDRELEAVASAQGLESIELETGNGSVVIRPSTDDQIHVRLKLSPRSGGDGGNRLVRWFLSSRLDREEMLEQIELTTRRSGQRLIVRPLPGGSARHDQVRESWTVEVPPRFGVDLEAISSKVEVTGVAGGVRVRQGHGSVTVDVPEGELDIALQVGNVVATSASSRGAVDVRSEVGDARVWLDDRRVRTERPPGPGSSFRLDGGTRDAVEIRVTVGNSEVRLGR